MRSIPGGRLRFFENIGYKYSYSVLFLSQLKKLLSQTSQRRRKPAMGGPGGMHPQKIVDFLKLTYAISSIFKSQFSDKKI